MKDKAKDIITKVVPTTMGALEGCCAGVVVSAILKKLLITDNCGKLMKVAIDIGIGVGMSHIIKRSTLTWKGTVEQIIEAVDTIEEKKKAEASISNVAEPEPVVFIPLHGTFKKVTK